MKTLQPECETDLTQLALQAASKDIWDSKYRLRSKKGIL